MLTTDIYSNESRLESARRPLIIYLQQSRPTRRLRSSQRRQVSGRLGSHLLLQLIDWDRLGSHLLLQLIDWDRLGSHLLLQLIDCELLHFS